MYGISPNATKEGLELAERRIGETLDRLRICFLNSWKSAEEKEPALKLYQREAFAYELVCDALESGRYDS